MGTRECARERVSRRTRRTFETRRETTRDATRPFVGSRVLLSTRAPPARVVVESIRFEQSLGNSLIEYENQRVVSITFVIHVRVLCVLCVREYDSKQRIRVR